MYPFVPVSQWSCLGGQSTAELRFKLLGAGVVAAVVDWQSFLYGLLLDSCGRVDNSCDWGSRRGARRRPSRGVRGVRGDKKFASQPGSEDGVRQGLCVFRDEHLVAVRLVVRFFLVYLHWSNLASA